MDCEKVRDRFSSLWEEEVSPSEEKVLKEHLSSCPKCQREFEQFGKTMRWLHSAGEVEVPEGFLPELYKKIEEKKRAVPGEKLEGRGFHLPLSFKLPIQAVAMVAVVFLVLYLTKIIPMEGDRLKAPKQVSSPLAVEKKSEKVLGRSEVEEDRRGLETSTETPRPKDVEHAKAPVPQAGKLEEASVPQVKAEAKEREAPARSTEAFGYQAVDSKQAARVRVPSPGLGKNERELRVQEKSLVASKRPQEIILKISDRKMVIPQLHELVKQFGGDVIATERDTLLASLPTASLSEFEKELAGFSSSAKADQLIAKKQATEGLKPEQGPKREEGDEKSKGSARLAADAGSRTIVRILLVED